MTTPKEERLAVRLSREQLDLIRDAAETQGRTVTDFTVQAATDAAADVLADQRLFRLSGARWTEFVALLDRPPVHKPKLADTIRMRKKHG